VNEDDHKEAIKEALSEWLDDKFSEFGKWSLKGMFAFALVGLVYLWAASHGWTIK
tara:strand:+ start:1490 stop:1654 length:165 start_codon:yes stop_codon:yes gene_type:complete